MKFEIIDIDALGRIGKIEVNNKKLTTPNIFPVIHPYNNLITAPELEGFGAECLFTNAYILYNKERVRERVLEEGLHSFLDFNGLIATDSGAFQQYMYQKEDIPIEPPIIEKFQEDIGSDFPVILDIPVQLDDEYEIAQKKVQVTINRAIDNIKRRKREESHWVGPIHGGRYFDLLKKSSREMSNLDFDILAIGGLVKGFLDYRFDLTTSILLTVKKYVPPNKPIHMFGLGLPQYFSLAVACGCDLMDSAAYILYAREERYFTLSTGTKKLDDLEEFPCHCPVCSNYTPYELRAMENSDKTKLLAKHNLYITFSELRTIRQAIREGNLWELVEQRIRTHPNLVEAARVIKKNISFFEIFEKIFKPHGRLYSSGESLIRPDFIRYTKRLSQNYRPPDDANFLIILPELDVKDINSPTINTWLKKLNGSPIREKLHIVFQSKAYGIIPIELNGTYPLGQFEVTEPESINDVFYNYSLDRSQSYFENKLLHYTKVCILVPDYYINQFGESLEFEDNHPIVNLYELVKKSYKAKISIFRNLDEMLEFLEASYK